MKKIDKILYNAHVLTINKDFQQYPTGAVAVDGDKIVAVGDEKDIRSSYEAKENFDCGKRVLMPGLINGHTHVPMTMLRGLSDDLRLDVWLMGYIMPVEKEFVSREMVKLGTRIACAEMIRSGTTTFVDMYYFEEEIARETAKAGMRAICGETVIMFPVADANSYEEGLQRTEAFIKEFENHPLIVPAVAPHAPYTTNPQILQECAALARKYDVPLVIHLAETENEVSNLRKQYGMPVIPYIKNQNLLQTKLIGAHLVHIDEGEIRDLAKYKSGAVHNPSSNMKLASGAAPIDKMVKLGVNVGIGTDGPSSNNDLDMFEEMRLTAFLSKLKTQDPTSLPAKTVIYMATRGGAKAVHLDKITGSLEPGKRADIILVDLETVHNKPSFKRDPDGIYAQLLYASKSTDVTDVMVNGAWLMKDRELLTIDEKNLFNETDSFAKEIDEFLIKREGSLLSKLIAIDGATKDESFEVQTKVAVKDRQAVIEKLKASDIEIEAEKHYRQYDTYLMFNSTDEIVRYREDELINKNEEIESVRARLTLIGAAKQVESGKKDLLSRSRFIAPAGNSLRFYQEYFKPDKMVEVVKDRLRYHVIYKGLKFFINLDRVEQPAAGQFLEVKSTTFSSEDAESKQNILGEILQTLGIESPKEVREAYYKL
ncbi:MAG: amidohydrolase family protein [Candidatus Riflebacteria bacterium]|nr:amidohydrolase family protein [Candidatus Riflebacteria bacterium]